MKRFAVAAVVVLAFVAGLVATFPSERLVAAVLARLPPRAAAAVEHVGSARLGPGWLTLTDVTLRVRADAPPVAVREVRMRPSLRGLLLGRRGRPWHVTAAACGGGTTADLDRDRNGDRYHLRFERLDLAACLPPLALEAATGVASGDAELAVRNGVTTGLGTLALENTRWLPAGFPAHMAFVAEQATLRWTLADRTIVVDEAAMSNPAMTATGTGSMRLPESHPGAAAAPLLDLQVRVAPTAAMPQGHSDLQRKLPGGPPDASGTRTFRIRGPLDAPMLGPP
jgi:type II secretion system protein N